MKELCNFFFKQIQNSGPRYCNLLENTVCKSCYFLCQLLINSYLKDGPLDFHITKMKKQIQIRYVVFANKNQGMLYIAT